MKILAVDPGQTTGLALFHSPDVLTGTDYTEWHRAWMCDEWAAALSDVAANLYQCNALVVEEFTIHGARGHEANDAIEIIGACKWLARQAQVPFIRQTPVDAKEFSTDAKLKAVGWFTPGVDHPRDATRHLLLYMARSRKIDPGLFVSIEGGDDGGS